MSELKELVGKTIKAVFSSPNAIAFLVEEGRVIKYNAVGDCCSHSWVEHVEDYGGIGSPVLEILTADVPEPSAKEATEANWDCLAQYGLRIRTATGDIAIEHRNDSNGYYGGSLGYTGDTSLKGMSAVLTGRFSPC